MKQCLLVLSLVFLIAGCKEKKTELKDDDEVGVVDFVEFFPETSLPVVIADTTLTRKQSDSLLIGNKIFSQFVPDSVIQKEFGKTAKPKLYPLGRTQEKGKETYLFVKAVQGNKRVGYVVCFDKDNKYLNALPIVRTGFDRWTSAYGSLDRKFQITTYREQKKGTDDHQFKRNIYVYNSGVNDFTLILTEPNEEIIENIINPIDTLAKKNKLSGDYGRDKTNFISFRDGKNDKELLFFVHFEKDKSECVGELKGTARIVSEKSAVYKEIGNPCTLEFTFNASNVVMKEVEGCGAYRDIKCFFEGTFPKKKEPKKKSKS